VSRADPYTAIILDSMNDGVLVIDFNGRVVFANKAANGLLCIGEPEMAEKNYIELFMSETENDAFNDILFNGIQDRETRVYCEVPFRRSDGKLVELAVTSSFLRNEVKSEQNDGIVVVFKDITESKALDRARQRILDHLSHELRTPLTIIKATLKRVISPENLKFGERIEQNLNRLQNIQLAVDEIVHRKKAVEEVKFDIWIKQLYCLLDIIAEENGEYASSINKVKTEITMLFGEHYSCSESINLSTEVINIVEQTRESVSHRKVSLDTEIKSDSNIYIDPEVLKKILITIIKNAIESTPDGGGIIISLAQTDTHILFNVKDSGIGITPESQAYIFNGFYHARDTDLYSTKKPYDFGAGGKGLELLRLKIFADLYQFTVDCESRRCIYIPEESQLCPGSIEACSYVRDAGECARAGGTTFRLKFRRHNARLTD
jgi:two-component system phosphate regulon sensor histidine kinase PhoR